MPPRTEVKFGDGGAVDVRAYGVDPSGTTSDLTGNTQALQAALNDANKRGIGPYQGAPVHLGVGIYKTNDTLVVPHGTAQYGSVGLVGPSPGGVEIQYSGPSDGRPALLVNKQAHFQLGNFRLTRSGPRGASVGVLLTSDIGAGTQVISGLIQPLNIDGFATGVQVGQVTADARTVAVSEMVFQHLGLQNCDVGIDFYGFNTLNHLIHFLNTGSCGIGLRTSGGANSIAVLMGGGAANTDADFEFGIGSPVIGISNWRTERVNRLVRLTSSGSVNLDNVTVADYVAGHDGVAVECLFGASLTLQSCTLRAGQITARSDASVNARLTDSSVGGPYPINLAPRTIGTLRRTHAVVQDSFVGGVRSGPFAFWAGRDPVGMAPTTMVERFRLDTDDGTGGTSGYVALNGAAAPVDPQPSAGAPADGTLADLTTKFNALQAAMKARGDVKP